LPFFTRIFSIGASIVNSTLLDSLSIASFLVPCAAGAAVASAVAVGASGSLYVAGTTLTELWPLVDPLPPEFLGAGGTQAFLVRIDDAAAHVPGDVNGDGSVTASDALAGLGAALGTQQCLPCVCDLNGDGNISATDALIILNLAVGIPVAIDPPAC